MTDAKIQKLPKSNEEVDNGDLPDDVTKVGDADYNVEQGQKAGKELQEKSSSDTLNRGSNS